MHQPPPQAVLSVLDAFLRASDITPQQAQFIRSEINKLDPSNRAGALRYFQQITNQPKMGVRFIPSEELFNSITEDFDSDLGSFKEHYRCKLSNRKKKTTDQSVA